MLFVKHPIGKPSLFCKDRSWVCEDKPVCLFIPSKKYPIYPFGHADNPARIQDGSFVVISGCGYAMIMPSGGASLEQAAPENILFDAEAPL
jgi:hypothetical protein